jgi:O-antigen ligase
MLILRIFPQYNYYIRDVRQKFDKIPQLSSHDLGDLISKIKRENASPDLFFDQPRLAIWKDYLKLIPKNPLGLGLNYYHPQLAVKSQGKLLGGYHNILLEFWTYGGITALGAFLYLFWRITLNIKNKIRDDSKNLLTIYNIGIASALFGLIIHSLFGGLIFSYFFWILLAMALI